MLKSFRQRLASFGYFLWSLRQIVFRTVLVGVILVCAWNNFIWLVGDPPVATTPALVMIWASVIALLLALFPQLLDKIKRVKLMDFELELQETIIAEVSSKFILASDLENSSLFTQKGNARNLRSILMQADQHPDVPVLLVVNVQSPSKISTAMLFTYLYLLNIFSYATIILFVDPDRQPRSLAQLRKKDIVGVITGQKALWTLYRRFPRLLFNVNSSVNTLDNRNGASRIPSINEINSLNETVSGTISELEDTLSAREVREWFSKLLSSRSIDVSLSENDIKVIRIALDLNDDFILSFDKNNFQSVIILNELTAKVAKRALESSK